jgi:hypothetical protein
MRLTWHRDGSPRSRSDVEPVPSNVRGQRRRDLATKLRKQFGVTGCDPCRWSCGEGSVIEIDDA